MQTGPPTRGRPAPRRSSARRPRRRGRCCRRSCGPARRGRTSGSLVAQLGRDGLVEDRRLERLEDALLGRRPEVAGVDGEVDVGLGVLALGGDPLAQLGVVAGEELDLDAGLLRPLLEGRLDAVVAARVHGEGLAVVAAAGRRRRSPRSPSTAREATGSKGRSSSSRGQPRARVGFADHTAGRRWLAHAAGRHALHKVPWSRRSEWPTLLGSGAGDAPALVEGDRMRDLRRAAPAVDPRVRARPAAPLARGARGGQHGRVRRRPTWPCSTGATCRCSPAPTTPALAAAWDADARRRRRPRVRRERRRVRRPRAAPRPGAAAEHVGLDGLAEAGPALARQPRQQRGRDRRVPRARRRATAASRRCRCTTATACRCSTRTSPPAPGS